MVSPSSTWHSLGRRTDMFIQADGKDLTSDESSSFGISITWRKIQPAMSLDVFPVPKSDEQVLMWQSVIETSKGRFV